MTRALLALIIAIGGAFALLGGNAEAAPLGLAGSAVIQSAAQDSDVILVRDGCGRGLRWSERRQACVEDFGGAPPPRVVGCQPGWRFSNNQQACVPAGGGVDPTTAIIGGVINQAIGGGSPRGCGPGMRWSDRRGGCVPL